MSRLGRFAGTSSSQKTYLHNFRGVYFKFQAIFGQFLAPDCEISYHDEPHLNHQKSNSVGFQWASGGIGGQKMPARIKPPETFVSHLARRNPQNQPSRVSVWHLVISSSTIPHQMPVIYWHISWEKLRCRGCGITRRKRFCASKLSEPTSETRAINSGSRTQGISRETAWRSREATVSAIGRTTTTKTAASSTAAIAVIINCYLLYLIINIYQIIQFDYFSYVSPLRYISNQKHIIFGSWYFALKSHFPHWLKSLGMQFGGISG